jgi:hypothetical protein
VGPVKNANGDAVAYGVSMAGASQIAKAFCEASGLLRVALILGRNDQHHRCGAGAARKQFFFEKKNQKTFFTIASKWASRPEHTPSYSKKSFFDSFFKKELLS